MDLGKDWSAISPAERGGTRIRNASRHHDAVLVGRLNLNRASQLRRGLQIWVRTEGNVPSKNRAGGFLRSKSLGTLSGSWQRLRVGGGLLEPELRRRTLRWFGLAHRGLRAARDARWVLAVCAVAPTISRPRCRRDRSRFSHRGYANRPATAIIHLVAFHEENGIASVGRAFARVLNCERGGARRRVDRITAPFAAMHMSVPGTLGPPRDVRLESASAPQRTLYLAALATSADRPMP
jgi:hypothetical protein